MCVVERYSAHLREGSHWFDQWTHKAWPIDLEMMVSFFCWAWRSNRKENHMTTSTYESLSHSRWDCKYHIVFIPKNRKKVLYGKIRKFLGPVFHDLANQRNNKILKGSMVQDHVHMVISMPFKYSIAEVIGLYFNPSCF